MRIETTRFGTLLLEDCDAIRFPAGLIGFPNETSFVLLRRNENSPIGWIQSTITPGLALPVVSIEALDSEYTDDAVDDAIRAAGLPGSSDSYALMAVMNPGHASGLATVNLLAPIVVNSETRVGAQVIVEGTPLCTQEPFILRQRTLESRQQVQAAPPSSQVRVQTSDAL